MNFFSQTLKDKLTPEQYKKIPPFLRHRDEPDLFYHLIYNCFIESINSRKWTKDEIQEACRIASGKKVPELLKAGDRIKIHSVMGTLDQPYFCNGNSRSWVIKNIHGPFGCCGSVGRATLVMFYADKSEPMVYCGCFSGTVDEFEKKIHERHAGTFHEYEYKAMVEHIRAIRKYQLEVEDEQ